MRPRRSCLYMPGANARALEKAKTLLADMIILDLEDAVAPEAKLEARDLVVEKVKEAEFGQREVVIRTNALDTEWGQDDLKAAVSAAPDGILIPKIVDADQVREINSELDKLNCPKDTGLWLMIEMPLAILNIKDIAAAVADTRLRGFVVGTNDLAKELNCVPTEDRLAFLASLSLCVTAARAYGLVAIDGVYNQLDNEAGLQSESEQGRVLGFDGKTLIHPKQLEIANQVFSPKPEDVEHAQAIISAFAEPENQGKGVIKVNGKMTELLHLEQAKQLVSMAETIASFEASI